MKNLTAWTMTIGLSTRCIPAQNITADDAAEWINGMNVTAGEYYRNGSGMIYMAVNDGISGDEPVHRSGVFTGPDGIGWIFCSSHFGENGIIACVLSGDEVHYNRSAAATTEMPWTIKRTFDPGRGDWHFVPADTGSTVAFLEL